MSSWRAQVTEDLQDIKDRATYANLLKKGKQNPAKIIDISSAKQGRSKTQKHKR